MNILLIGLRDGQALKAQFEALDRPITVFFCQTLEQARTLLLSEQIHLFFLDTGFDEQSIYTFYQWMLDRCPTYGILVGDVFSNYLGINSINAGLIFQYYIRPITPDTALRALAQYSNCRQTHPPAFLTRLQGSKLFIQAPSVQI